jgi:hypothetical protein
MPDRHFEYEDGFVPEEGPYLYLSKVKTAERFVPFLGKKVKAIRYAEPYCDIRIEFTDDTALEISANGCEEFDVDIMEKGQ